MSYNVITIEGASSAYGAGSEISGGWGSQLHRSSLIYNSQNALCPLVVVNVAVPGMALSGLNKAAGSLLERYAGAAHITRVLSVGQNEARRLPDGYTRIVSLERFRDELGKYSLRAKESEAGVVYVGPQKVDERLTWPMSDTGWYVSNQDVAEYADAIRDQALADGMPYVDVAAVTDITSLAEDGRHLNDRGHTLVFEGLKAALPYGL